LLVPGAVQSRPQVIYAKERQDHNAQQQGEDDLDNALIRQGKAVVRDAERRMAEYGDQQAVSVDVQPAQAEPMHGDQGQ
jgi:hypothetical protein